MVNNLQFVERKKSDITAKRFILYKYINYLKTRKCSSHIGHLQGYYLIRKNILNTVKCFDYNSYGGLLVISHAKSEDGQ